MEGYYEKGLYYPLLGINNVGDVVVKEILEEREKGLFKNYDDFVARTASFINKKQFVNLVNAGALDCFNITRKSMNNMYELVLQKVNYIKSLGDSIINTEFSDEINEDIEKMVKSGMNGHISKPIEHDKLISTLSKYMN